MDSFLLKLGNRHFPLFKIVSYRVMIRAFSGIWKNEVFTYSKKKKEDIFAVRDVVV